MPSAPSLWLVVFWLCFQIYLPDFVLARLCLDAVSMSRVLQFTVIWDADVISFGVQNVSCGMLVTSTLTHFGNFGSARFRGTLEQKKGDLGFQAWISIVSMFGDFGTAL